MIDDVLCKDGPSQPFFMRLERAEQVPHRGAYTIFVIIFLKKLTSWLGILMVIDVMSLSDLRIPKLCALECYNNCKDTKSFQSLSISSEKNAKSGPRWGP